jgi:hypothetical protein
MSVVSPSRSALALSLSFDSALCVVSECIAEARSREESGDAGGARAMYGVAERYAVRTGFAELLRLVRAYQDPH